MRTYREVQESKKKVEELTKEYFNDQRYDNLVVFGIGFITTSYVIGLTTALWYEGLLIF